MIADKGYDSNKIIQFAENLGIKVIIPPKLNRIFQRDYNKDIYKKRHLVENAFLHLKQWRGVSTRYAKNINSFLAIVHIRCMAFWGNKNL